MKIKEVASLKEALSTKAEKNHKGDYKIQAWENGRELVIQLPDSVVHYRWKEDVVNQEACNKQSSRTFEEVYYENV